MERELTAPWLRALRLLHPFPSLLVTAVTLALVPLADAEAPLSRYLALGAGMLSYQFAIGVSNDLIDSEDDARAKPWKAIPSGAVSRRLALALALAFVASGVAATLLLPAAAFYVGIGCLLSGLAYNALFKRTALSWLPYAVAMPLLPTFVFTASRAWDALLWWVFPLGILLGFALQLANQAADVADSSAPLGLPGALGARAASRLAIATFGAAASLATIVLLAAGRPQAWAGAAIAIVGLLFGGRATRLFGRDGAFGVLAVSSALLAIAFVSAA